MNDEDVARVLSKLTTPHLLVERSGKILYRNSRAKQVLGAEAHDLLALADDPRKLRGDLANCARSTTPLPIAFTLRTPTGTEPFRINGSRYVTDDGVRLLLQLQARSEASSVFASLNLQIKRLQDEVAARKRAESLSEGQRRLLQQIARGAPLREVLAQVTNFVEALSSSESIHASVLLLEDGKLRLGASPTLPSAYNEAIDGLVIGPSVGSCGTAAFLGREIVSEDIATDPRWDGFHELARSHGLRACWSAPVILQDGEVVATLALYYSTPTRPHRSEIALSAVACSLVKIAIERDRTQRELIERARALAENDRRKDEFLAMLGHELRNPLSPIMTSLELLRSGEGVDEQKREWLDIIQRKSELMRRLVDDLLDISRVTRGAIQLHPKAMDLRELTAMLVPRAGSDRRLRVVLPDNAVWVRGDSARIQQVVDNLVNNACKFTDDNGHIEVTLEVDDGNAKLCVRDDGVGMHPEEVAGMFELFTQSERTLDRSSGGLGIGLTLVKSIVEAHGGTVEAFSEGLGKGSRFEVSIPALDSPPEGAHRPSQAPRPQELHRSTVLVVDDEPDNRDLLALLLTSWGFETTTAEDGPSAIAAVTTEVPDVIVLDIGLPVIDGFEVARRIRTELEIDSSRCTIVALTGYGQPEDQKRARNAGCDSFLVKPVEVDALRAILDVVITSTGDPPD